MRVKPAATVASVLALLALVASSLVAAPATASTPGATERKRPVLALAAAAPSVDLPAQPTLSYSFARKPKGEQLVLQRLNGSGNWRQVQGLRGTQRPTSGSGTVTLSGVALGEQTYRVALRGRRGGWVASSRTVVQVYGAVPMEALIRSTAGSAARIRRSSVVINGVRTVYDFYGLVVGTSTWRRVVEIARTSCKGIGVPLIADQRTGTGGLFTMRVVTDGDALVAANSAATGTGAGLLTPVPVGQRLGIQVGANETSYFYGSGQAICYTDDGRA